MNFLFTFPKFFVHFFIGAVLYLRYEVLASDSSASYLKDVSNVVFSLGNSLLYVPLGSIIFANMYVDEEHGDHDFTGLRKFPRIFYGVVIPGTLAHAAPFQFRRFYVSHGIELSALGYTLTYVSEFTIPVLVLVLVAYLMGRETDCGTSMMRAVLVLAPFFGLGVTIYSFIFIPSYFRAGFWMQFVLRVLVHTFLSSFF